MQNTIQVHSPILNIPVGRDASFVDRLIHSFLVFPEEIRSRNNNVNIMANPVLSQCGSLSRVGPFPAQPTHPTSPPSSAFYLQHPNAAVAPPQPYFLHPQSQHLHSVSPEYRSGSDNEVGISYQSDSEDEEEKREMAIGDGKSYINVMWVKHFEELKKFKQKHYHTNVTRTKKDSRVLGNWVAEQRRKKKQGRLNQTQIDLLNSTGFEWEKRKKRSSQPSSPVSSPPQKEDKSSVYALLDLGGKC
eukprot:TRINITY_DN2568_c0_g1_i1.p1 TRINITY_DN2568_c0_g1~~TRINITY_DN2568_c0_g1_i1.p1  ORF type:complete len:245 (-),score=62.06 TRINITY_DN2568_c0_g1_i1:335-1069(-)